MTPAFVGFIVVALVGGAAEMASAFSGARKNRLDLSCRHRARERFADRAIRRTRTGAAELPDRPGTNRPALLAGRGGDGARCHAHRDARDERRPIGLVRRRAGVDGVHDFRHDALPIAAPNSVNGTLTTTTTRAATCGLYRLYSRPKTAPRPLCKKVPAPSLPKMSIRPVTIPPSQHAACSSRRSGLPGSPSARRHLSGSHTKC